MFTVNLPRIGRQTIRGQTMVAVVLGQVGKYWDFIGIHRVFGPIHIKASGKYSGFEVEFLEPPQDRPWIGVAVGYVPYHDDIIADFLSTLCVRSISDAERALGGLLADYKDDPRFPNYIKFGICLYDSTSLQRFATLLYDKDDLKPWDVDDSAEVEGPVDPMEYAYEFQVS